MTVEVRSCFCFEIRIHYLPGSADNVEHNFRTLIAIALEVCSILGQLNHKFDIYLLYVQPINHITI